MPSSPLACQNGSVVQVHTGWRRRDFVTIAVVIAGDSEQLVKSESAVKSCKERLTRCPAL